MHRAEMIDYIDNDNNECLHKAGTKLYMVAVCFVLVEGERAGQYPCASTSGTF